MAISIQRYDHLFYFNGFSFAEGCGDFEFISRNVRLTMLTLFDTFDCIS